MKGDAKARLADTAIKIILDGKMFTTVPGTGKNAQPQKLPSDAIQRCFTGKDGKDVAGIVIARAKAEDENGEKLRDAFNSYNIDLSEWEEWINSEGSRSAK